MDGWRKERMNERTKWMTKGKGASKARRSVRMVIVGEVLSEFTGSHPLRDSLRPEIDWLGHDLVHRFKRFHFVDD